MSAIWPHTHALQNWLLHQSAVQPQLFMSRCFTASRGRQGLQVSALEVGADVQFCGAVHNSVPSSDDSGQCYNNVYICCGCC